MVRYITIPGTHSIDKHDWFLPDSYLTTFLKERGCEPLVVSPLKRYMWSTALDGIDKNDFTWDMAGRALAHYICPPLADSCLIKPEDTYLISHSHGGNVVAYACGKYGLKVNGLITVGMPIRKELYPLYKDASFNIKQHLHLYTGWKDYWQVLGAMFDGRFGIHRKHPYANINGRVPNANHGSILRDPTFFHYWDENKWVEFWKGV